MIPMLADAKIWLAAGVTHMWRGFNGLAAKPVGRTKSSVLFNLSFNGVSDP